MSLVKSTQATVPQPSRRNPFKPGGMPARQFDNMLKLYAEGHRDLVRPGPVRCMGNNMAVAFWKGYDRTPPHTIPKNTPLWACYRAGQTQRLVDDEQDRFVPARTNSIVQLQGHPRSPDRSAAKAGRHGSDEA